MYLSKTYGSQILYLLQGGENSSFGQMFHILILKLINVELSGKH